MGENSKIQWTDHTFNPWIGCAKVSPGCAHCYAENETFARVQRSKGVELWGPKAHRHVTSPENWRKPLAWNAAAAKAGVPTKVFCASLADVFEDRPDLVEPRARLLDLISRTPSLHWQLLTKRPENVTRMVNYSMAQLPDNVWIGTTVEDQQRADERIPALLDIPAKVRFLSCEPLLGPIDFEDRPISDTAHDEFGGWSTLELGIHWVICGGESGNGARPMNVEWARGLRDQCVAAGVPFHFKQWGEYALGEFGRLYRDPTVDFTDGRIMVKIGKKAAGRLLDGREWNEFPAEVAHG